MHSEAASRLVQLPSLNVSSMLFGQWLSCACSTSTAYDTMRTTHMKPGTHMICAGAAQPAGLLTGSQHEVGVQAALALARPLGASLLHHA